jgi:hypothetical protein
MAGDEVQRLLRWSEVYSRDVVDWLAVAISVDDPTVWTGRALQAEFE